jgi:alcohol dehydrogenase
MRGVLIDAFGQPPVLADLPDPGCPETGVVVEVAATGLCRSDWHAWMGHAGDVALPHVPGHEFAGVLAEVGGSVRDWRVGDRVTVPFVCACGQCATCRRGEQQVCENQFQPGFTHWGSFAEFVAIDRADVNLVRVPDEMNLETAAGLGCRFSTAYRAVTAHGRVAAGDWVAVHGCGGVGLAVVMIAAARGAQVIAVDRSPAALALARAVGAVDLVDARAGDGAGDVVDAIIELSGGGAQVSFDALGATVTMQNSVRCLRPRGRHVQIGLLLADDDLPPVPMARVIARELELIGSHGIAAHAFPALLGEIADGRLAPQRLITRRIDLAGAPAALADLDRRPGDGVTMITVGNSV